MKKWFYKVYGLIVESDIEIPELLSIDKNENKVDIKIKRYNS